MGTDNLPLWRILFTDITDYGLMDGTAFITGWIITVILIIMTIFSLPYVRSRIYQVSRTYTSNEIMRFISNGPCTHLLINKIRITNL
jgi:hypothetical protein